MVACSERQRVRGLLAEAITMLCKTSLQYKLGFSIEGLLGITVDNNQVFLINLHEEVRDKSWSAAANNQGVQDSKTDTSPSQGPIDLRTNCHNVQKRESATSEKTSLQVADQVWHSPEVDRLSPDLEESQIKEEDNPDDLPVTVMKRNGTRASQMHNGASSAKQRKRTVQTVWSVKREQSPDRPRRAKRCPLSTPPSAVTSNELVDLTSDVIFIKDEEDSNSSLDTYSGVAIVEPPSPRDQGCVPLEIAESEECPMVKLEDDPSPTPPDGSPPWRETSPNQVTYEAGTWAANAGVRKGSKAKRAVKPTKKVDGQSHKSKVHKTPIVDAHEPSLEESELTPQAVSQVETDHTEWPADPADVPRRPRASYSTAYKLMVVRKAIESGNMRATARRFGIHFKQVWQWTRNKEKLLAMSLSALRSPRLWPQAEGGGASDNEQQAGTSGGAATAEDT